MCVYDFTVKDSHGEAVSLKSYEGKVLLIVNGKNASPLYDWLKEQDPEDKGDKKTKSFEKMVKILTLGNKKQDIKWNFGKFLIDRNGDVAARYSPAYLPESLEQDIEALLK
jgi:glutathione peroxidase